MRYSLRLIDIDDDRKIIVDSWIGFFPDHVRLLSYFMFCYRRIEVF